MVGIIGDPVEHTRSPAMHNAGFAALGLNFVYVPLHVRTANLAAAVAGARALGVAGFNVTVPHKERVLPFLDGISRDARRLGAVNTVVRRGARLLGHNTDGDGFLAALAAAGIPVRGRAGLVIGAGGAARAVLGALLRAGCGPLTIVNRTSSRAHRLRDRLGRAAARVRVAPWRALADPHLLAGAELVINATSLGLHGEPIEGLACAATPRRCVFVDLIYGPRPTPFLLHARRARRRAFDGLGMLLHQGALAFSLWTGRRAPLAVMRRALAGARRARAGGLTRVGGAVIQSRPVLGRRRR